MKMIGNVSDWLSYAGGALIKVADSAGSTVFTDNVACSRTLIYSQSLLIHCLTHHSLYHWATILAIIRINY